jgi:hypothetical protein
VIDVERPRDAPVSLVARRDYRARDVLLALHAAFFGKCYLCETPVVLGTFTVDHRRGRGDFPELEHVWSNLFPACTEYNCNGRREKKYPEGGLLDPGEGVEQRVAQQLVRIVSPMLSHAGQSALVFRAQRPGDVAAENTARELDRIHNGTGSTATDTADSLRAEILGHVTAIAPLVYEYAMLAADPGADAAALHELRWRVARIVSRRAPYSMLVRSCFAPLDAVRVLFD